MRLVLGLGNPGERFERTRHNVGFDVVRRVSSRLGRRLRKRLFHPYLWSGRDDVVLALPLTYMNRSGSVIPGLLASTNTTRDDLVVVCDNMDLPPGTVRVKRKGSSRAHNGLSSIMDALGTGAFTRVYVGVGRPEDPADVVDHVLSVPLPEETDAYRAAIEAAADAIVGLLEEPVDLVMNRVNRTG